MKNFEIFEEIQRVSVTAWSSRNLHTRFSNVLSSIFEYVNDSFKENSREECEAFAEVLVAVL